MTEDQKVKRRAYEAIWRARNREKLRVRARERRLSGRWKPRAVMTEEQKVKKRAYEASWRDKNREKCRARWRAARAAWKRRYFVDKEHARKIQAAWRARNPEAAAEKTRRWTAKLPDAYVRSVLSKGNSVPMEMWPDSVVEAQRAKLKIQRLCQNLKI
jgi:hypothetical protein